MTKKKTQSPGRLRAINLLQKNNDIQLRQARQLIAALEKERARLARRKARELARPKEQR